MYEIHMHAQPQGPEHMQALAMAPTRLVAWWDEIGNRCTLYSMCTIIYYDL